MKTFLRSVVAVVALVLAGSILFAQEVAGTWQGTLQPPNGQTLRIVIRITITNGQLTGDHLRSPDTCFRRFFWMNPMHREGPGARSEPSTGMLAVAVRGERPKNLAYLTGSAEQIPLAESTCDLAWLSHVWHHIRDHQACADDLRRVLRRGCHVLVRGTFGDQLDGFPTLFQFWPSTRQICEQLPTVQDTVAVFETSGFTLAQHRRIQQETASSLSEFAKRTRSRADSALMLISDSEFLEGQIAIEAVAAVEPKPIPVVEVIELLAFRNDCSRMNPH